MRLHTLEQTLLPILAGCVALAVSAGPATATTYVPMSDAALADRAAIIVEARVVESEPSPDGVRISTDYTMRVDRILKGDVEQPTIVVRVPGGRQPYGVEARVAGAPVFEPGERALLFLRPTRQSVYAIEQLMLGAFHRIEAAGSAVWVRDVSEAHLLRLAAGESVQANDTEAPRHARRFSDWLAARGRGGDASADYRIAAVSGELRAATEEFRFQVGTLAAIRWFAFDENRTVNWATFSAGQAGLPGGGHDEFQAALAAWNADPNTNVSLGYSGQTAVNSSFDYYGGPDGLNVVAFETRGDLNPYRFDCATGGLLSTSIVYLDWQHTTPSRGHQFQDITEADIATSPGISCLFEAQADPARRSKLAEELFGHELGHALGLGDSSSDPKERNRARRDALMYAYLHADGRGARLGADDRQGLRQLYGKPSRVPCRQDSSTLCLQNGRFAVTANFYNPHDGSRGEARTIPVSSTSGLLSFSGPADVEAGVKILNIGGAWRVFVGQLNDFGVGLTVFDTETYQVLQTNQWCRAERYYVDVGISPAQPCKRGPNTLCLLGGRLRAELSWHNQFNDTGGEAKMIQQSDAVGLAYYTQRGNIEMLIEVEEYDGQALLLYAPLSDLEYELRLTDLTTGVTEGRRNGDAGSCF
jgi:matrixin